MRLLVIDGNSIANRAFYGIKLLTTKDGRYTNAIFGFLNILLSLLKECGPDEVAVAFDLKAPTFRHKMYDAYQATLHKMPDELAAQMPVLKELLAALGYREVTAEGWEADDILGALSARIGRRPVLLTGILGLSIMMIVPAVSQSLPFILLSRLVGGMMSSNIVVAQAYFADVTPSHQRIASFG